MTILVFIEHDRGTLVPATFEALTFARELGGPIGAVVVGAAGDPLAADLAPFGVDTVHQAHHDLLTDYGADASADAVTSLVRELQPTVVMACGTDRGNEVLAGVGARLDAPFVANVLPVDAIGVGDSWELSRVRWGGSLHERVQVRRADHPALDRTARHRGRTG